MFEARPLSSAAIEVLMQLFVTGPVWDGNLVSKSGRSELVGAGLAFCDIGWTSLTAEGVSVAVNWDRADLSRWHDQRWIEKLRQS